MIRIATKSNNTMYYSALASNTLVENIVHTDVSKLSNVIFLGAVLQYEKKKGTDHSLSKPTQ